MKTKRQPNYRPTISPPKEPEGVWIKSGSCNSYSLICGDLRIVIVWAHIYHPAEWSVSCERVGINLVAIPISKDDVEKAKTLALDIVHNWLQDHYKQINAIIETA